MRKQELENWLNGKIVKVYRLRGKTMTLWFVDYYSQHKPNEFARTMVYAQQESDNGKWYKL